MRNSRSPDRGLDNIDFALLSILQEDCTLNGHELSEALKKRGHNLGNAQCNNRRRELIQRGFIKRQGAILNPKRFGVPQLSFMFANLSVKDRGTVEAFKEAIKDNPNILEVYEMTGICDYLMKIRVSTVAEAARISHNISDKVSAVTIATHHAGETVKETTAIRLRAGN